MSLNFTFWCQIRYCAPKARTRRPQGYIVELPGAAIIEQDSLSSFSLGYHQCENITNMVPRLRNLGTILVRLVILETNANITRFQTASFSRTATSRAFVKRLVVLLTVLAPHLAQLSQWPLVHKAFLAGDHLVSYTTHHTTPSPVCRPLTTAGNHILRARTMVRGSMDRLQTPSCSG